MTRDDLKAALQHPNVQAFLRVVREGESGQTDDAYRVMYGGGFFSSFNDHPRQKVTTHGITSSAAGAYQFLEKTWDGLVAKYGFDDFSPACQDEAAVALIHGRGALQDLLRGDLSEVLDKCSWEWASLPPGRYGQTTLDPRRVYATYNKWLAPTEAAIPTLNEVIASVPEKKMAAPFIGIALEALLSSIPTLIRHFGKGSRSEDNAKLAEAIVPLAKDAIGAVNEQEVIEKLGDPDVIKLIDKKMQENFVAIIEAGGGGIEGAREFNLKAASVPLLRQPAFVISLVLLLFPLMMVVDVFFIHPEYFTSELRTQVVTGILLVISIVGGYWLGSSMSSRTKDELIAKR